MIRRALPLTACALAACASDAPGPAVAPVPLPAIEAAAIRAGPHNVLSAVVTARVADADSARIRFGLAVAGLDSVTPAIPFAPDTMVLPLLGLLPDTVYRVQVVAYGPGGLAAGDTLDFRTGPLPIDLPAFSAGGSNPSPGYVVFAAYPAPYGVAIDNSGRVVWYRRLEGGLTLNFEVQATGTYATSPTQPAADDPSPWVEYDFLGNEVRRLGCVGGLKSRFHELLAQADGSWWILCDETRVMDLSALGGHPAAEVTGTVVQHVDEAGSLLFQWSAFDHFAITDLDSASRAGPSVNWTHGNALAFDSDGGLLVSFRSLNEITRIDPVSGAVRWRLGGLANQFHVIGASAPFAGQHGVRVSPLGGIVFLDNRGLAGDSRTVRYALDGSALTATELAAYHGTPPVTALLGGSTQPMANGHTLTAYGNGNRVQEYDETGAVVWEIHGNAGYVFRAQRIGSLYRPGAAPPAARQPPDPIGKRDSEANP